MVGFQSALTATEAGKRQRQPRRRRGRRNGEVWQPYFCFKRAIYGMIVWFGDHADARDRAAVASIISSIRA